MTTIEAGASAVWGFLVGFVGWTSCFRLIAPVADWLLPVRSDAGRGLTRLLVAVFLLLATLLIVAVVPLLLTGATSADGGTQRRDAFGVAFMSSLAGLLVNGMIGRFGGGVDFE
jgi:hypothetical protein